MTKALAPLPRLRLLHPPPSCRRRSTKNVATKDSPPCPVGGDDDQVARSIVSSEMRSFHKIDKSMALHVGEHIYEVDGTRFDPPKKIFGCRFLI